MITLSYSYLCRFSGYCWSSLQQDLPWHRRLWGDVLRPGLRHHSSYANHQVRVQIQMVLCSWVQRLRGGRRHTHMQSSQTGWMVGPNLRKRRHKSPTAKPRPSPLLQDIQWNWAFWDSWLRITLPLCPKAQFINAWLFFSTTLRKSLRPQYASKRNHAH